MNKFLILLKKEIKELLTLQMFLPMIMMVLIFFFIGNVIGKETKKSQTLAGFAVIDLDRTVISREALDALHVSFPSIPVLDSDSISNGLRQVRENKTPSLLVIPTGFGDGMAQRKPQSVEFYSVLTNLSIIQSKQAQSLAQSSTVLNEYFSRKSLSGVSSEDPSFLKTPIRPKEFLSVGDKLAEVSFSQVSGFIMTQSMLVPIILFMVIIVASQLVAVTIATEKENKTLETLLSVPVGRKSIVTAKLMAAGLVALLSAAIYMLGFRSYMNGITGGLTGGAGQIADSAKQAIASLGLTFGTPEYIMLGVSLFLGIIAALAVALVLGAFAEDVKSVQSITAPIMILIFIPYLLTIFVDLSTASPFLRYLVYAIPFSYPFLASSQIIFHKFGAYFLGNAYLLVFFLIFVVIAARIFSTDKIITMKLRFRRSKN